MKILCTELTVGVSQTKDVFWPCINVFRLLQKQHISLFSCLKICYIKQSKGLLRFSFLRRTSMKGTDTINWKLLKNMFSSLRQLTKKTSSNRWFVTSGNAKTNCKCKQLIKFTNEDIYLMIRNSTMMTYSCFSLQYDVSMKVVNLLLINCLRVLPYL